MRRKLAPFVAQSPDRSHLEIAINVNTAQRRNVFAAINVTARDADADAVVRELTLTREARIVRILDDWIDRLSLGFYIFKIVKSLARAPAIVASLNNEVHFLPFVLPHIGRP